jgi:hypothetical protein
LWGSPFRAFPFPGSVPPLGGPCPPVVPLPAPPFRRRMTRGRRRLQGLVPPGSPLPPARCLGSPVPDALLGFLPSRVLPLPAVGGASTVLPSCPWLPARRSGPFAWTSGFCLAGSQLVSEETADPSGVLHLVKLAIGARGSRDRDYRFSSSPTVRRRSACNSLGSLVTLLPEPDGNSFR